MAEGLTNPQIGEKLFISENTVKTHTANICQKMGFIDGKPHTARIRAVIKALQDGLLELEFLNVDY